MPARHPLLRRLPTTLVALSAALWVVTVIIYARSCFVGDLVRWSDLGPEPRRAERRHTFSLSAGVVEYYTFEDRRGWVSRRPPGTVPKPRPAQWVFTRAMDPYEGRPVRSVWNRLGFRNDRWTYPFGGEHLVVCPLWPLLVGFAAVPVGWDVGRRVARKRAGKSDASSPPGGRAEAVQ
jgi:hypothetical protein